MSESNNSNTVFWLLLVCFLSWANGCGPFNNSTSVFITACTAEVVAGVCGGQESTGPKMTYRADKESQAVTFWGSDLHPMKYNDCAITDAENWSCSNPNAKFSPVSIQMWSGILHTSYSPEAMPTVASVTRWHWWGVWFDEANASLRAKSQK